ncbi:cytochrome P450 [Paracoccus sp. PS-1]|uniref:cytochrome P450 n=1 Tax=unclassified Paracoccus (in: a-proteobacteria) TaxID=2688777 RepID=UPI00048D53A2|nr:MULTISPECIES: cytochrome P450 [unclassified Paracoccus (in: a-proteobacteria)]MDQ7260706.1 cytochrome P450 [Paracoccus sp. PS1]
MKTFQTFDNPDGWASAAEAFRDDFAAGERIQIAPWGGYAILGHRELVSLARNPLADGMAPDPAAMAETPALLALLDRALFTKSGEVHRTERAALIAAFNTVPLAGITREAVRRALPSGPARIDLRTGLIAPVVRRVWGEIIGLDATAALQMEDAVRDLAHVLSLSPDPAKAHLAEAAAGRVRDLSLAALQGGAPFSRNLRDRLGDGLAADLIAGMAFDAIESAATGLDAALRVAFAHRDQVTATAQCANECLRLASSTPMTMRLATGRIALGDLVVEAGTVLSMVWAAGNHDPLAFPAPERFDPDREGARPLMFGMGQHACLGHAIIRATLVQLLGVLETLTPETGTLPARWSPFAKDYLPVLGIRFEG